MVFQWDHDNWSTSYGGFKPAYFGWSFLESCNQNDVPIDNDEDGMIDEFILMVLITMETGIKSR